MVRGARAVRARPENSDLSFAAYVFAGGPQDALSSTVAGDFSRSEIAPVERYSVYIIRRRGPPTDSPFGHRTSSPMHSNAHRPRCRPVSRLSAARSLPNPNVITWDAAPTHATPPTLQCDRSEAAWRIPADLTDLVRSVGGILPAWEHAFPKLAEPVRRNGKRSLCQSSRGQLRAA